VAELTSGQTAAPAYFAFDADLNKRRRPTLETALASQLRPLTLDEALRRVNSGAVLLDVRDPDVYAGSHVSGSINVGLSGRFAAWCGELLRPDQSIVLLADPGREREAATRLGRIGFDRVVGFVEGGARAFASRPELVGGHRRIDPAELRALLASPRPPLVVDVRAASEWEAGHIDGSRNEPLPKLRETCSSLPRDATLVVQCLGGYRSSIACSLLEQQGFGRLLDLRGGWNAWTRSEAAAEA
jgi:hydroxyacylglutathione hydrolase